MGSGGSGTGPVNGGQPRADRNDAQREWTEYFKNKLIEFHNTNTNDFETLILDTAITMADEVVAVFQTVKDSFERQLKAKR